MMWWKQRTASEKRMLVICILVLAIGLPVLLIPSGGDTKKLLPASEARQKYEDTVLEKNLLTKDNDQLKPVIEKLVYKDAPEQLLPKIIKTLQGYAKQSGIHLREIKPLRAKVYGTVTRVPVSVRFTSEFGKSVPFLYQVEDPAGKLVVEKFNVTAADSKSKLVDVEVQIALYTQGTGTTGGTDTSL
jgi:Tfp pilus assembly protein PilO